MARAPEAVLTPAVMGAPDDRPEGLIDVPAADVLEPEPLGPLVEVARAPTVVEAELLRARLVNAGLRVAMRDKYVVGTDPLISAAVRGVKVLVAEVDVPRARAVLDGPTPAVGPVFRVEERAWAWMTVAGLGLGALVGVAIAHFVGPVAVPIAGVVGGVVGALGGRRTESFCTNCHGALTPDAAECPRCGGRIAGVLRHANERLEAEERLRRSAPTPDGGGSAA